MRKILIPFIAAVSGLPGVALADVCYKHRIVGSESSKKAEELFQDVKKNQAKGEMAEGLKKFLDRKKLASYNFAFRADVDNDGKKEAVFTIMGSGAGVNVEIHVFAKGDNGKYLYRGAPPAPAGVTFAKVWRNKNTKQIEFLSDECGIIYLNFDANGTQQKFLWKDGQVTPVPVK